MEKTFLYYEIISIKKILNCQYKLSSAKILWLYAFARENKFARDIIVKLIK